METKIELFKNDRFGEVRIIIDEKGYPLFCAVDVCNALGYSNGRKAIIDHVDVEDVTKRDTPTSSGIQSMTYINESGLYSLVLSSKLDSAKDFKKWVTGDVIPSIRKHGAYMTPDAIESILTNPDTIIKLATQLKEVREENKRQQALIEEQKPKVEFFNAVTDSRDAIDMGRCAKIINMGIGRNKMFAILRERKILDKNNIPYQSYIDNGWFRVIEQKYTKPDGTTCINIKTVVYQKGVDGIRSILKSA